MPSSGGGWRAHGPHPLMGQPEPVPLPRTPEGRAGIEAVLADPARALVALDYDGTLAPIVDQPSEAVPASGALHALGRLAPRVRLVVVITGRPAPVVVQLAGFQGAEGLEHLLVLGQYGLQRWDAAGGLTQPEPLPGVTGARRDVSRLLAKDGSGLWLEDKEHSLVVHARATSGGDAALERLAPAIRGTAEQAGLEVHPGRSVLELRPPGHDKGGALLAVIDEYQADAVLVAGDDLGDLPAFAAVEQRRAAGHPGCTVASDSAELDAVRERADLVVDGPAGVVALLEALADELDARGSVS